MLRRTFVLCVVTLCVIACSTGKPAHPGSAPVTISEAVHKCDVPPFTAALVHGCLDTGREAAACIQPALAIYRRSFRPSPTLEQPYAMIGVAAVCAVLHGAMALYLTRYLNVPPARIPGENGEHLDDLPADADTILATLLDAFDRQRQVDLAARLVARHLTLGHSPEALIATLARAVLREDAGFHAYQMLEAGVRQFIAWGNTDAGRNILIAVARYLAAHSPTERAALQTADIARRLMRGGELHQEAS